MRFRDLTAHCPSQLRDKLRSRFAIHGAQLLVDLTTLQTRGFALMESVMSTVESATEASYAKIDEALSACRDAQEGLGAAAKDVADAQLMEFIHCDDYKGMVTHLRGVGDMVKTTRLEIVEVERSM